MIVGGGGSPNRAGASPAPTIHGPGRPIRCIVGATLAVALGWGPCCNLSYVRASGSKPTGRGKAPPLLYTGFASVNLTYAVSTVGLPPPGVA